MKRPIARGPTTTAPPLLMGSARRPRARSLADEGFPLSPIRSRRPLWFHVKHLAAQSSWTATAPPGPSPHASTERSPAGPRHPTRRPPERADSPPDRHPIDGTPRRHIRTTNGRPRAPEPRTPEPRTPEPRTPEAGSAPTPGARMFGSLPEARCPAARVTSTPSPSPTPSTHLRRCDGVPRETSRTAVGTDDAMRQRRGGEPHGHRRPESLALRRAESDDRP